MTDTGMKKTRRRIVWGILAACTIAALLLVLTWAQKPRWRTFTFPANPKTGVAVAIDYPDDWQIGSTFQHSTEYVPYMQIGLAPRPPQGIVRWWMEKVLRQEVTYDENDVIQVFLASGSDYKDLPALEKEARGFPVSAGTEMKLTHERHALGPALAVSGTMSAQFMGQPQGKPPFKIYATVIDLQSNGGSEKTNLAMATMISVGRYPRFAAAISAMLPRMHLIRPADPLRHP